MKGYRLALALNLLFANFFLMSMEAELPVLLMLGYDRDATYLHSFPMFIKKLWDTSTDYPIAAATVIKNMELITIDKRKSCLNDQFKHIQANPETYDFSRYSANCKEIFIQMLSCQRDLIGKKENIDPLMYEFSAKDYISEQLLNLSKYLSPKKVTIEWFAPLYFCKFNESVFNDEKNGIANPFFCFISKEEVISLMKKVLGYKDNSNIHMEKYKKQAQECIALYTKNHIGCKELKCSCGDKDKINDMLEEELEEWIKTIEWASEDGKNCSKKIPSQVASNFVEQTLSCENVQRYIDFVPKESILFFLIQDIFMMSFQKNVKNKLEQLGFTQVNFKKGNNKLNGHENVHIITAIKG